MESDVQEDVIDSVAERSSGRIRVRDVASDLVIPDRRQVPLVADLRVTRQLSDRIQWQIGPDDGLALPTFESREPHFLSPDEVRVLAKNERRHGG